MTKKPVTWLLASLVLLGGAGLPMLNNAQLSYFRVEKQADNLVITWQATAEDGLKEYMLERRTPFTNGEFKEVKQRFLPHGTGKPYRYQDDQLYKSLDEEIDYRLYAVYTNNERQRLAEQKINYTSTSIRRTWGSIKAMFQ